MSGRHHFHRIDSHEARQLMQGPDLVLLDCRLQADYQQEHIGGASPLGSSNIETYLTATPRHTPVLIYCYHGNSSQVYAQMFTDFGFAHVYSLDGGFEAWKNHPEPRPGTLDTELQNRLIAHGFSGKDIEETGPGGVTPLMRLAAASEIAAVSAILESGARLHRCNEDGNQALWYACIGGNLQIIRHLAATGADLDHQNDNGATCLMYAASSGREEVLEQLLLLGANPDLQSLDDYTALDMAASLGCLNRLRTWRRPATPKEARDPGSTQLAL